MPVYLRLNPPQPAFLCSVPGGYADLAERLQHKYRQRLKNGTWTQYGLMTLRNAMVALIKANDDVLFADAEAELRILLRGYNNNKAGFSPAYWALYCVLISCLILCGRPEKLGEARTKFRAIEEHEAHRMCDPVRAEYEELKWVYYTGKDYLVLRESDDAMKNLTLVKDYDSVVEYQPRVERYPLWSNHSSAGKSTAKSWWKTLLLAQNRRQRDKAVDVTTKEEERFVETEKLWTGADDTYAEQNTVLEDVGNCPNDNSADSKHTTIAEGQTSQAYIGDQRTPLQLISIGLDRSRLTDNTGGEKDNLVSGIITDLDDPVFKRSWYAASPDEEAYCRPLVIRKGDSFEARAWLWQRGE